MTKKDKDKIAELLEKAFDAARKATDEHYAKNPNQWFPCGFAWVRFPGKSPVVTVLKEVYGDRGGHKGYPKGWDVWNPSADHGQWMDAKVAGANAFAKVMNDAGYECYADCRMD
jgi:hypothetical protein